MNLKLHFKIITICYYFSKLIQLIGEKIQSITRNNLNNF